MTLTIGSKIDTINDKIIKGDKALANKIARAGIKAIFTGIGEFNYKGVVTKVSPEWEALMKIITNDSTELARLCGKEEKFNKTQWGLACLAYIAGDSTCTSNTTFTTGMKRSMLAHPERKMLDNLDRTGSGIDEFVKNTSVFTEPEPEPESE